MLRKKMSRNQINSESWAYLNNDLGATILEDDSVVVNLWSPSSFSCELLIFDKNNSERKIAEINMQRSIEHDSIWTIKLVPKNMGLQTLDSYYYQFKLDRSFLVLDPYAKSMASFNPFSNEKVGKAAFVNMNSYKAGKKPVSYGIKALNNEVNKMIAYEMHVRDFTISATKENLPENATEVALNERGTFKGLTNWDWGINYLKDLGITHVQFLPLHNYFTVNENIKDFNSKIDNVYNYNWGYDPHSYFSIEGWLSTNANDPYARIKELRDLVNKLHENNIGVIVDVVYNHMFKNEILDDIEQNVYFREKGNTVPVGAPAVATENFMTKKLILDSISWLVDEYGVDGFRFDLMGFLDSNLIKEIRNKYPDIILYGEAWNFTDILPNSAPIKGITSFNTHKIKDLGYFNDSIRKSVKGNMGHNESESRGYINGDSSQHPIVRSSIVAGLKNYKDNSMLSKDSYDMFANTPSEAIQYQAIHDGLTLWDKINIATDLQNKTLEEELQNKINVLKQSLVITLTSQGRVVLQGGDEMGRSKPLVSDDTEPTRVGFSKNTIDLNDFSPFDSKYHENSYKSCDTTNSFKWNRLKTNFYHGAFKKLSEYVAGLIKLRKQTNVFRFETDLEVINNLKFIENPIDSSIIQFSIIDNDSNSKFQQFFVAHNPLNHKNIEISKEFDNSWEVLVNQQKAGIEAINGYDFDKSKTIILRPNESIVLAKLK